MARPGRPPAMRDASAARSEATPRWLSADSMTSSGTRPNCTVRDREATVSGRSSSDSTIRMKTVDAVGSSMVLSSALAADSLMAPASSNRNTLRSASTGVRVAAATVALAWSTPSMVRPWGTTTVRSGWLLRPIRPATSSGAEAPASNRAAKARATVALPTPVGPTNR